MVCATTSQDSDRCWPMAPADLKSADDNDQPIPSVLFYQRHRRVFVTPLDTCLEIGRQRSGEDAPTTRQDRADSARIVFAPLDDVDVSLSLIHI